MTETRNRVLFALALLFVWASGVNMATHHWWDAAGDVLLAALLLAVASIRWDAVFNANGGTGA